MYLSQIVESAAQHVATRRACVQRSGIWMGCQIGQGGSCSRCSHRVHGELTHGLYLTYLLLFLKCEHENMRTENKTLTYATRPLRVRHACRVWGSCSEWVFTRQEAWV